jgi:hypothetical protein
MPTDKSEPRTGLILKVGVAAIATLVATHAALVAYFDRAAQGEEYRKIGAVKAEALMGIRADEKQRLQSGPIPIDKAMQMMKERGRGGAGADIMPSASPDIAPMQGWVKLPGEVPSPMMMASAAQSAPPAPSAAAAADAGAFDAAPPKRDGAAPNTNPPAPKNPHKQL